MPVHEAKTCSRCGKTFECKAGDITQCQCYTIPLSIEEKAFIEDRYHDCLCAECLLQLKNRYITVQRKIFIQLKMICMKEKAFFNWSGGKDSALALYRAMLSNEYNIQCLLTNINSVHDRVSMHGVRRILMEAQAASTGLPLVTVELPEEPSMKDYETIMLNKINTLKTTGCSKAIFGDIFLEDLKIYREQKLKEAGIECIFPLWKIDTTELIKEFISLGFKAIIVCINEQFLDKSFCGRSIDASFLNDLPSNVDVCGENGEFHSFVFDGPIFKQPVKFKKGDIVYKQYEAPKPVDANAPNKYGFWFCDLIPQQ